MGQQRYVREPLDTVFETAGISYVSADEVLGDRTYAFTVWPEPRDSAVEDFGRYLAVLDAFIDDTPTRHHVYDRIRTDGERCYLPEFYVADTESGYVLERDALKQRAFQEYPFDADAEDTFVSAYETVKTQLSE